MAIAAEFPLGISDIIALPDLAGSSRLVAFKMTVCGTVITLGAT
jgi:hypothetical protein